MILQGKYFGPLNGMAQGKIPMTRSRHAQRLDISQALSAMPWDGFTAETKDRLRRPARCRPSGPGRPNSRKRRTGSRPR